MNFSVTATHALYHFGLETEHFHRHGCRNSSNTIANVELCTKRHDLRYIGVREGIVLGGRKKFALKITICPETNFFSLIRIGPETSCKSVLYS